MLPVAITPVQLARHVSESLGREVWVKRDDLTHAVYGGNKVRKLAWLLEHARTRGATDLVTVGAVGSHHVLATATHGRAAGFAVSAVLVPQPRTDHVEANVRADLAEGAHLIPARGAWEVPWRIAAELLRLRLAGRRPYFIAVGGSSPRGAAGYVDAVRELVSQHRSGELPGWPDEIVCALGSGGTLAGILAGVRAYDVPTRVIGVRVAGARVMVRQLVAAMARRALVIADEPASRALRSVRARDVTVVHDQMGAGYGHGTDAGSEAMELFARDGVMLDPTYTAKAAAGLIARARSNAPGRRYLFWHTLSSAPRAAGSPDGPRVLPPALRALMT